VFLPGCLGELERGDPWALRLSVEPRLERLKFEPCGDDPAFFIGLPEGA
jgi:hypothetical protein